MTKEDEDRPSLLPNYYCQSKLGWINCHLLVNQIIHKEIDKKMGEIWQSNDGQQLRVWRQFHWADNEKNGT